jgi:hypothetical protein
MRESSDEIENDLQKAISDAFDEGGPLLIEVRFPRMGTSPDWYLCEDEDQLAEILAPLSPKVEVYASSVWDLVNPKGAKRLR